MNATGDRNTVRREDYLGSPLSVQVVGPKLQERRLWDTMTAIEDIMQSSEKGHSKL